MTSGEDLLFRPLLEGIIRYESLKNGEIDLFDITKINEALDVKFENQKRFDSK